MIIPATITQTPEQQLQALELLGNSKLAHYDCVDNATGNLVAQCAFPVAVRDCQNWHDGPIIDTDGFPLLRKSNDHHTIILVATRPLF